MHLLLIAPKVAYRSCADCQRWLYDENTGKPIERAGVKFERGPTQMTPCRLSIGCAKGTPEEPKDLTEKNWQAWTHYQECRAVGQFPDDPIVRRNAAVIRGVLDAVERLRQIELATVQNSLKR